MRYLEAFYTVCTAGGFTAAADRLGCTQPAISYQIRALERVMRAKLVERGGRRVVLTPAGEQLKTLCRQFFAELARVRNESAGGVRQEPLRLSSASGFGRYVLVPALHALQAARPALELRLWFDSAEVVLNALERGECEAAFVYTRRMSNRLRYRAVFDEELVLIADPSVRRRLMPNDLDGLAGLERFPFITYEEGDYVFGRWFEGSFGEQPAALRSVAHFSELEEVVEFVRRGAGLSIVPRDCVALAVTRGEVDVLYAGRRVPCMNQVFMAVRSESAVRPELQQLSEVLRRTPVPAAPSGPGPQGRTPVAALR